MVVENPNNGERKKALKTIYKYLHDDNWQRGQGIWIANSILVTGSLIVVFQSKFEGPLPYLIGLMLVITADFLHLTGDMITSITYKKMETIGHDLGLDEIRENYQTEIKNKWWYPFRKGASYLLFSFLIASYLFLWLGDLGFSFSVSVVTLFLTWGATLYYVYKK